MPDAADVEAATRIGRVWAAAASHLRVRSALNPMLWLCAIVPACCFTGAVVTTNPYLATGLFAVGSLPVVFACWGFAYFAVKSPHHLQSEEYQIRRELLKVVTEQKGRRGRIDIMALDAITNPERPLPKREGDKS